LLLHAAELKARSEWGGVRSEGSAGDDTTHYFVGAASAAMRLSREGPIALGKAPSPLKPLPQKAAPTKKPLPQQAALTATCSHTQNRSHRGRGNPRFALSHQLSPPLTWAEDVMFALSIG
jgi:hypothetical protein